MVELSENRMLKRFRSDIRQSKNIQNPNKIVWLLDVFEIRTILQPNNFALFKIRTSSDFGTSL